MNFVINPGAGPVAGYPHLAHLAVAQFVVDVGLPATIAKLSKRLNRGRCCFTLRMGGRECRVEVPALPVKSIRFTGRGSQDAWQFPRLYVDGNSWLWKYAVSSARGALAPEPEIT